MKNLKKLLSISLIFAIMMVSTACSNEEQERQDAVVAARESVRAILDDFDAGSAISYTESYDGENYVGEFTYKRDANGNVVITDKGTSKSDQSTYDYTDYKIGDTYYEVIDGVLAESVVTENFDPVAYFEEQTDYVSGQIEFIGVETLAYDIDNNFTYDETNYTCTGEYENAADGTYTLTASTDGTTMNYVDNTYNATVTTNFTDTVALPQ